MDIRVIEKLFFRFQEKGFDTTSLNKQEWFSELNNVKLDFFKFGLLNSKELPTAKQFKEMCNPLYTKKTYTPVDHKDWAKKIIRDWQGGLQVRPISLKFAKDALRMK
jgi:hypothetical protein